MLESSAAVIEEGKQEVNENLEINCWKSDYYHMRKTR